MCYQIQILGGLSQKLENWNDYSFSIFIKELTKAVTSNLTNQRAKDAMHNSLIENEEDTKLPPYVNYFCP